METKEIYVEPEVEVFHFEVVDIITTSNGGGIELPDHEWSFKK